jgi:uncharacterized protein with NRDE domain
MCIMCLAVGVHPTYPFILLFNRDESFTREASVVREWNDGIYGKDLVNGGTWLAFGKTGKFAALTNFSADEKYGN